MNLYLFPKTNRYADRPSARYNLASIVSDARSSVYMGEVRSTYRLLRKDGLSSQTARHTVYRLLVAGGVMGVAYGPRD